MRVCRPGGRIGLASWTPSGFVGQLLKTVGRHVPPPSVAQSPTAVGRRGRRARVVRRAGRRASASPPTSVTQRFVSAEAFADFFLAYYGPTHKAAERLSEDGRQALRDDMVALAAAYNVATDGTFVSDWEYLIVLATKR